MLNETAKAKKNRKPLPHRASTETDGALLPGHLFKSFLLTLAIGAILLLLFSLIAYFSPDPNALITPLGLIAATLTSFLGGVISVRLHGHSALLCGLCNAILLMLFMLPVSLFFSSRASLYSIAISVLLHAGVFLLSLLGAYLALPKKNGRKKKKH